MNIENSNKLTLRLHVTGKILTADAMAPAGIINIKTEQSSQ
jgi:hypothetical protein